MFTGLLFLDQFYQNHSSSFSPCRLAFSISVVCILSAAFSGFFLSVAGVMGKVCGSHNNFSEILENVIDSGYTWSDQDTPRYPLAHVLLNLPEYPLKVADTLDACRSNMSLFHAFHLEQRYDLKDRIWLNPQEKVKKLLSGIEACMYMHVYITQSEMRTALTRDACSATLKPVYTYM